MCMLLVTNMLTTIKITCTTVVRMNVANANACTCFFFKLFFIYKRKEKSFFVTLVPYIGITTLADVTCFVFNQNASYYCNN